MHFDTRSWVNGVTQPLMNLRGEATQQTEQHASVSDEYEKSKIKLCECVRDKCTHVGIWMHQAHKWAFFKCCIYMSNAVVDIPRARLFEQRYKTEMSSDSRNSRRQKYRCEIVFTHWNCAFSIVTCITRMEPISHGVSNFPLSSQQHFVCSGYYEYKLKYTS